MKGNVAFTSLGCDKNRVDSEVMLGLLQKNGFTVVADEAEADIIVINTCCFIKDALDESIETILEMSKYKENGKCKGLLVAGCLGQRYEKEIFKEMPEVDAVLGTAAYEDVARLAEKLLLGENGVKELCDINRPMNDDNGSLRVLSTAGHMAYLKISEGCDNHCTYCVIPSLRGKHRSRKLESLVAETEMLAAQGVKELVLVAQDTSVYGRDLYEKPSLDRLLTALCKVEGIEWIRLLYCYPETLTEKTIEVMAKEAKICNYIDMPIQHGCDSILKAMGRHTSQKQIREKIARLRSAMPDIAIRTTLIVGFPGETEEDFQELIEFVEDVRFERLGVFTYSQEEGTPAAVMAGLIADEIKEERKQYIMELQSNIAQAYSQSMVGKNIPVLIEGKLPDDEIYCGRTKQDAPDIDGFVFATSNEEILTGDIVMVQITDAREYDLIGDAIDGDELGK